MRAPLHRSPLPLLLLSLCLAMGCGAGADHAPQGSQDSGPGADGASDAGSPDGGSGTLPDASTSVPASDAGSGSDAGASTPDAGSGGMDAGAPSDAGSGVMDGGSGGMDAGSGGMDAGASSDAGPGVMDGGSGGMDAGSLTPDAGSDPCAYLGDITGAPDFTPTALGPDLTAAPVTPGSIVSVIKPFQGGRVSFIGVHDVINMDPCGMTLLGAFRDPVSRQAQIDSRTINLKRGADGRGSNEDADDSTFSNVPLCPNNWSSQDLYDKDYELTVILKDKKGKSLQKVLTIRPSCNVPGEVSECQCICKQGYKLGTPCP